MLRIDKVSLQGFKSFCDPVEVVFDPEGITAVVGPNGCGKSNLSEAISWVIGEQRARALRGGKMEDVIFQGSGNRSASGMAEVTLTMVVRETFEVRSDNIETAAPPDAPLDTAPPEGTEGEVVEEKARKKRKVAILPTARVFQEGEQVTVGRRLYRTGESEYEMNGRTCRLRDIQDLFSGTGLGGAHYAIIEQGRIGQVLSAKPLDRRALIEEAAGVSKFKMRQHAAELKLEASKLNLSRLTDIITEIERQQNSLKRQAARARRYQRLRGEMRDLMRAVYVADYRATRSGLADLESLWEIVATRETESQAQIVALEAEQAEAAQLARGAETELNETRQTAAQANLESDRAQQQHAYLTRQLESAESRADQFARDREAIVERSALVAHESQRLGEDVTALEEEIKHAQSALAADEESHQLSQARDAEAERHLEQARTTLYETTTHLERWRQLQRQFAEGVDRCEQRMRGLRMEQERAEGQSRANDEQGAQFASLLMDGERRQRDTTSQLETTEAQLVTNREERTRQGQSLATLQREAAATEHRLRSLAELDERHAYFSEAVQRLLRVGEGEGDAESSRPFRTLGTLADHVYAEVENESMIEAALRDELQFVIVPTFEDAFSAIDFLKTEGAGRATFVVAGFQGAEQPTAIINSEFPENNEFPDADPPALAETEFSGADEGKADSLPESAAESQPDSTAIINSEFPENNEFPNAGPSAPFEIQFSVAEEGQVDSVPEFQPDSAEDATTEATESERDRSDDATVASLQSDVTLLALLGLKPEFAETFARALPALASAPIVSGTGAAVERVLQANGSAASTIYLTRSGERIVGGRLVSGGSTGTTGAGVLALRREINELREKFGAFSHVVATSEAQILALDGQIASLESDRVGLDASLRSTEKELAVLREQCQQAERERQRIASHLRIVAQEANQVEQELSESRGKFDQATTETTRADEAHSTAELAVASTQTEVTELRRRAEARAQEIALQRADFAAGNERRRGLHNDLNRLGNEARDLETRLNRSQLESVEAGTQIKALQDDVAATDQLAKELTEKLLETQRQLTERTSRLNGFREQVEMLDASVRKARDTSTQAREERARLELDRVRLSSTLEHIAEACQHELGEQIIDVLERLEQAAQSIAPTDELQPATVSAPGSDPPGSELIDEEGAGDLDTAAGDISFWQVPEN
ncbi:MAG: AAA family ATPase, partial [Acidobacteriota bacterium]